MARSRVNTCAPDFGPFSVGQSRGWLRISGLGPDFRPLKGGGATSQKRLARAAITSCHYSECTMAAWALALLHLLGTIERSTCLRSFRCRSRPLCRRLESTLKLRTRSHDKATIDRHSRRGAAANSFTQQWTGQPTSPATNAKPAMPSGCRPCVQTRLERLQLAGCCNSSAHYMRSRQGWHHK